MTLEKHVNDFAVAEHLTESERVALITYVRRFRADGYRVVKLEMAHGKHGSEALDTFLVAEELT